jgi:ATP-dependent helicase/nuclease subunit A
MSGRVIPPETLEKQAKASDPRNSAWVSANAGSGKTHVLAQRVIRLLLDDVDPSRILCLTYTKAAAANMSNRVFKNLAAWAVMGDEDLSKAIAEIDGEPPQAQRLARARRLFARALETPGGLKIQTIHAFCEAVLHQFPLEANIAGHFDMLDGQKEQALVAEARRDVLTGVATGEHPELAGALEEIIALSGEDGLNALLAEIVGKRDALKHFISEAGIDYLPLYAEYGFAPSDEPAALAAACWPDSYFTAHLARAIDDRAAAAGKLTAGKFAASLSHAAKLADPLARLDVLGDLFFKLDEDKNPTPKSTKQIMAKGVAEHFPDFEAEFGRYAMELAATADRVALLRLLHATRAALTLADVLIARYEHMKAARGLLDFNDLITRTVHLLARPDVGPWVAFKLDRGIDHILVDEAQDTSPLQWDVVGKLAAEFFVGAGQRGEINRTIFAVGDEKQSIYSFQGADPRSFRMSGQSFRKQVLEADGNFEDVRLQHSFRSTSDVLSAVDLVFSSEVASKGLTGDPEPIDHPTVRAVSAGHVELWPLIEPSVVEEPDDWADAIDHASAPAVLLAERIAGTIDNWIKTGETIGQKEGAPRRIRPGDVLVLVRKRDRFIHALTRALKDRLIAVAGADRLSLTGHIAVKD